MEPSSLDHKIQLCYVHTEDLWRWIKENSLLVRGFDCEKEKWAKEANQQPNFFSDTELLLIYQDIVLLKVFTDSQAAFLAKTYRLECQNVCQKLFQKKKNILIITDRQWKMENNSERMNEKAIILFKDKDSIEKNLASWLKEAII